MKPGFISSLSSPASILLLPFRRAAPRELGLLYRLRGRGGETAILDPGGSFVLWWNSVFLATCLLGLFVDPLHFYIMYVGGPVCMKLDPRITAICTTLRTISDLFYFANIYLKFRIAFIAPSSRVFGRGELVTDPQQIAIRYLKGDFIMDLICSLPIPQIIVWGVIPAISENKTARQSNNTLSMIIILQYFPRLFLFIIMNGRIVRLTGVVSRSAWFGAAYNLGLYMLASHGLGALWYMLSMERQYSCWTSECDKEGSFCSKDYFDCNTLEHEQRQEWLSNTTVIFTCDATNSTTTFNFGMFAEVLNGEVVGASFLGKYLYCLWWGLKNLSSYGQNLDTSTYVKETLFAISICVMGLVLFAHLIGKMQAYLASSNMRVEEWRVKRRDIEEWMRHRQLPHDLQERVRRFVQYKWIATRGVDEESILRSLPLDLRREIQRHLSLSLVRRVPFFSQMDDQLLDAICERLVSSLSTKDTYIVREGDPVNEMIFVIRGQLESSTTNGGRTGFFNCITLRPGDFCGEELLTWALMPNSSINLPLSTRTVRALDEVEAFALRAEDLKFVAHQFKRLHSRKLQHAFRYYSHQWRTWGACFIQAAWRRFKKRKLARELASQESHYYMQYTEDMAIAAGDEGAPLLVVFNENNGESPKEKEKHANPLGTTLIASKFAKNTKKGAHQKVQRLDHESVSIKMPKLMKPQEPDFSMNHEDSV